MAATPPRSPSFPANIPTADHADSRRIDGYPELRDTGTDQGQARRAVTSMPKVRLKKKKTRPQLARMVGPRVTMTSQVRVVCIQSNPDGSWHPVTVGSRAAIARAQPRIEAIMAKLRGSY